jgi:DNA-binding MarR family transcriptional regulator
MARQTSRHMRGAAREGEQSLGRRSAHDRLIPIRLRTTSDLLEECARLILRDGNFIGFTELRILGLLVEFQQATISEISRDLLVDKAWISRRIKALTKRGLVHLARHATDSRMILVGLSQEGRTFFDALMEAVQPHYAGILTGIDEVAITAQLDQMEQNLRDLRARLRLVRS